jgi:hypothetical protein
MKNFIAIAIVTVFLTSCATKSSFHSFYEENKTKSDFSISSPAFMANIFIPKEDLKEYEDLFSKVKYYKVMIFSDFSPTLDKKFNRFIESSNYTSILRINQNGDKIQFYLLKKGDIIKEMILKVKSDNDFVLLGLKTNILEYEFNTIVENSDINVVSN